MLSFSVIDCTVTAHFCSPSNLLKVKIKEFFFKAYTHKDKDNGQRDQAIKFWTVKSKWKRYKLFQLTRESCLKLVVEKQRTNITHTIPPKS